MMGFPASDDMAEDFARDRRLRSSPTCTLSSVHDPDGPLLPSDRSGVHRLTGPRALPSGAIPIHEACDEPTRPLDVAEVLADDANDALYRPETIEGDELPVGSRVGRYSLLGLLGEGGMGIVYEAWDPQLDRRVALKVLRTSRAHAHGLAPDALLLGEAQTLAKIEHPNIVTVYDAGTSEERVFLAMELCRGRNLREWLTQGRHGVREILDVFVAAGRGLAAAHQAGVIHRDFKLANVLIGQDGSVRVADFGMARLVALAIDVVDVDGSISASEHDRSVSTIVGTPTYMAPEQLLGRLGDHRMDQFSFCLSLYWALLGHPPFPGRTFQERRRTVPLGLDTAERERLNRARKLPVRVRRALLRGLSVAPEHRFPSMDALLAELVERRRWPWALSALALATGLGLGAFAASDVWHAPCENPEAALDGAWGPAARQGLAEAIEQAHHPNGAEQLERAAGAFGRYTEEWKREYSAACEATYVTRVQSDSAFDLRMRCLKRRRAQLEIAVATVSQASDSHELDARMTIPFRLPALDECGDVAALEGGTPSLEEGPARARVDALVRRIDSASTMREAGLLQDGMALASAAVSEARELDHLPLLAQALECLGRLQVDAVAPQVAEETLREAIAVGTRGRDDHTVALAWPSLVFAMMMQGKLVEGESLGFAAELAIDRSGDEMARGWLYNTLGALHGERANHERARDYLQRALGIKIRLRGAQDLEVGITWINLGFALGTVDRWGEASDAFGQAQAILAATVGPTHPLSDVARSGLCLVELEYERYDVALTLCSEALGRLEASSTSPVLKSRLQLQTARALHGLGHRDRALRLAEHARRHVVGVNPGVVSEIDAWTGQVRGELRVAGAVVRGAEPTPPAD